MLIVSQDKEYIVNMENIISIYKENKDNSFFVCCMSVSCGNIQTSGIIGEYISNTMVEKVMRQILDAYANGEKVFYMPEDKQ